MAKKTKKLKNSHTSNSKLGMGDHYGTGKRNPPAKMVEGAGVYTLSRKQLGTPPRSLA